MPDASSTRCMATSLTEERRAAVDELIANPEAAEAWRLAQELAPPASGAPAIPLDRGAVAMVVGGGRGRVWRSALAWQFANPWRSAEPPVYRSTEQRAIASLLPSGQPLSRSNPVLRWTGIDGARYRVTVLTPALDVIEEADNLSAPEYTVSADALARFPAGRAAALASRGEDRG